MANSDTDQLIIELRIAEEQKDYQQIEHLRSLIAARERGKTDDILDILLNDPGVNKGELQSTLENVALDLERTAARINSKCFATMEALGLTSNEKRIFGWFTNKQEKELAAEARAIRRLGNER